MSGLVVKDPASDLLYTFDWTDVIPNTVTLDGVIYTLPTGVVKEAEVLDAPNKKSTIRLSGGTHGVDYVVEAKATLSNGEKPDASLLVRCFNL
jgi:hypothetical protein